MSPTSAGQPLPGRGSASEGRFSPTSKESAMRRIQDRIAIVTGGAHGIGRAISELFAAEGAAVFIADIDVKASRRVVAAIKKSGGKADFIRCDVSSAKQVAHVVERATETNRRIDVLCNNAAFLDRW